MPMDFETDPTEVIVWIEEETKKYTIETAENVWNEIMKLSPVLRGRYRASWTMSEGSPDHKAIMDGGTPGSPISMPRMPKITSRAKFPIIFITNGSPYAERIEYGWSGQAPYGVAILAIASV